MTRFFAVVFESVVITIGSITLYATPPVIGKPWHQNTREHLFGFVENGDVAYCSIGDEGFRWRNSFNFTVNAHNIDPSNWWFNKVVRFNPDENSFSDTDVGGARIGYINNASANNIHTHLTEIAWNVKNLNQATISVAAAITIVIEHGGRFYAFSKVLTNERDIVLISSNGGEQNVRNLAYTSHKASIIRNNLQGLIPLNLPFPGEVGEGSIGYSCSEGKILSMLVGRNFLLFKSQIEDLFGQARTRLVSINGSSIHTIILHINTTMDPCAICTRCMVGLSKHLNERQNRGLLKPTRIGGTLNANFFIEVSSNDPYGGANPDAIGSFTGYFAGIRSSHAECGGHDGREGTPINLKPKTDDLFPAVDNSLLVLPGGVKSWRFNNTFPPYIVFGRVNSRPPLQVTVAPRACATHREHNLPFVQ